MLELKHLKTLLALRESQTLVDAAACLCLTQSALSHQLKLLEKQIGAQLFIRKSKPLRFTIAGLRLLELADLVLPQFEQAERDLTRLVAGQSGRLHLAIECHSCFNWLMPAIDIYRGLWPDVALDFSSGFSFEPLPELAHGDLDLVLTTDPLAIPGIHYQALFAYQPMLAVSVDHPLANKEVIEPEDFMDQTLISYPVKSSRLDLFNLFLEPAGVMPKAIRQVDMTMMMMQLVASDLGVAVLPNWALNEYVDKGFVVARALGDGQLWQQLYVAMRDKDRQASHLRAFLQIARQSCFEHLSGIRPPDEDADILSSPVLLNRIDSVNS
ncbi:LysR substrate-binding domain-containing protein [Celerinatantimonas diazotrophica]|uniref:HTH-type transcriptional regulator MetR n=1 Tax=Celerinatantimonas diazotrophica TaxID=412034 RepID=A0A4R1JM97_9GAMM|nr:LysR substrate-binding domain-containing protein [Celerinatantimonas diazotrophica]TCK52147.1 LysR family transcriptional regulator [Celerinatantimonas diazotrophica]CAG9296148.1 HTH-type transcriptional regulator MetR [Celerinatantimonas diazotrophica]